MGCINSKYSPLPFKNWWLISYCTRKSEILLTDSVQHDFKKAGCMGHLTIVCGDVTPGNIEEARKLMPDLEVFNEAQAQAIVNFIEKARDSKLLGGLVVHCDAGISRSGATGTFAIDLLGLDYERFSADHPWLRPNYHILSLLNKASGLRGKESAFGKIIS